MCNLSKVQNETEINSSIGFEFYFPSPIYFVERKDFLQQMNVVSEEYLAKQRLNNPLNSVYPLYMSENYELDPRVNLFASTIGKMAWEILDGQGYDMRGFDVVCTEMWTQEHHKSSSMEQHTHGYGSQLVGFYFLQVPEDAPHAVFYDPRIAKMQMELPEKDTSQVSVASRMINFKPKPGLLVITNSWVPHSFGRNPSNIPFKFIHFNLSVQPVYMPAAQHEVEIV